MAVQNISWWPFSFSTPAGSAHSWTQEVNIPPQTVYAYGSVSHVAATGGGWSLRCGVVSYVTHAPGGSEQLHAPPNGLSLGIFAGNVIRVTFTGGGSNVANGDCTFQIFGFG